MKRLILVLMLTMMVAACGETTTEVVTPLGGGNGGGEYVPPDTVIKTEDATARIYSAGSPVALQEVTAIETGESFDGALNVADAFGYDFDPARVSVALVRLDDGRDAVLALGMLPGGDGTPGAVVYVRVGNREETVPVRLTGGGGDGFDVMTVADKTATRPDEMWGYLPSWMRCLGNAMADIMACIRDCPDCWIPCVQFALAKLVFCLQFTMM